MQHASRRLALYFSPETRTLVRVPAAQMKRYVLPNVTTTEAVGNGELLGREMITRVIKVNNKKTIVY